MCLGVILFLLDFVRVSFFFFSELYIFRVFHNDPLESSSSTIVSLVACPLFFFFSLVWLNICQSFFYVLYSIGSVS